jgi:O-antigen ligase
MRREKVYSAVLAGYLLLCILLGGSAQGVWGLMALEILGIALIAAAAALIRSEPSDFPVGIFAFIIAVLLIVLLQLVPLPPGVWAMLPGRAAIANGFDSLGIARPQLPLSEVPYQSVMTLFSAIPALASFIFVLALKPRVRWIAAAVVAGTVLSVMLGALQVANGPNSWAYPYRISNTGAVGFFANHNHMATLLLISIPLGAVLVVLAKSPASSSAGRYGLGTALLILIVGGIALNGSLAASALALPVVLASASLFSANVSWRRLALAAAVVALVAGVALIGVAPVEGNQAGTGAATSLDSRVAIWTTTSKAIQDSFPFGTGLGSFEQVYRQFEDPALVTSTYVNHAHNDYLELLLELGLAGAVMIAAFLGWWLVTAGRIWRSQFGTPAARAATIATAVVLAHSIVDFPLRTAAVSSIFGACLGLMAQHSRSRAEVSSGERRPTRHVKLG